MLYEEQPAGAALFLFFRQNNALSPRQHRAVWPPASPADTFLHTARHPSEGLSDGIAMCYASPFYRAEILTAILTTIDHRF